MRDLRAPAGTGGARYALAALAVALLALLSMHGWASHTGAHDVAGTSPSADVTITAGAAGASAPVVLAVVALGIARLLAHRRVHIPRTLLPAWQPPVPIGRDRDQPGLRMLCVIRC